MRLLWWTLAVISLSLFTIVLSQTRTLDPVQNLSLNAAAPMESGIRQIAGPVADFFEGVFNRGSLKRENERLRQELEALQSQIAVVEDIERRSRELEAALGIRDERPEDEFVVADVIAQDPSGVKRVLAINRGSKDGLDEGMVVLSPGGSLVGAVFQVYEDFSWLRLLTDPNSAVNVAVLSSGDEDENANARGVAAGDLRGRLNLEMVPGEVSIEEGDPVMTSGLGGNFPRALVLGTVRSVEERPQALFKTATVEPAAELEGLDTVLVLTNFLPVRLAGP